MPGIADASAPKAPRPNLLRALSRQPYRNRIYVSIRTAQQPVGFTPVGYHRLDGSQFWFMNPVLNTITFLRFIQLFIGFPRTRSPRRFGARINQVDCLSATMKCGLICPPAKHASYSPRLASYIPQLTPLHLQRMVSTQSWQQHSHEQLSVRHRLICTSASEQVSCHNSNLTPSTPTSRKWCCVCLLRIVSSVLCITRQLNSMAMAHILSKTMRRRQPSPPTSLGVGLVRVTGAITSISPKAVHAS